MKIKTGDKVRIHAGKDKGKEGTVLQVFADGTRLVIEGANLMKRHLRSGRRDTKGQIIDFPSPVHISNVTLISPKSGKTGRIGYKLIDRDGLKKKIRVLKTSGSTEDLE